MNHPYCQASVSSKKAKSLLLSVLLVGVSFWLSPSPARGVSSDRVLITQGGQTLADVTLTEGQIFGSPIEANLSFFNIDVPFGSLPFVDTTIVFTEPGTPKAISDILEMTVGGHIVGGVPKENLDFSIISDVDPAFVPSPGTVNFIEESGTLQDVTSLLFGASTAPVDVSVQSAVPEPSTLFLLGSSLAGLGGFAWRRRRRK
jgi:hypothetical protein